MKKLIFTLFVAIVSMATMTVRAFDPPVIIPMSEYFMITNKSTDKNIKVSVNDFSSAGTYEAHFSSGGVYEGDEIEITYNAILSMFTPQLVWFYRWILEDWKPLKSGLTVTVPVKNVPLIGNVLVVQCDYYGYEQSSPSKRYTIEFPSVQKGNRITVKSSDASEVQVTYNNYEEVSAGQRASIALYDRYGNKVSGGYLDALGMGTLSTKGKSGIYIVKVTMNNVDIYSETIQVR